MDLLNNTLALIVASGAAAAVVYAFWRRFLPWWREVRRTVIAGKDALVGRDAVLHPETGKELAPAVPGIGQRMATVEEALVMFARNQHTLNQLQEASDNHEDRIVKLEEAAVERVVARAESTAAWRAVEAVANAEPDHIDVEDAP